MPDEDKVGMTQKAVCLCESTQADLAGDEEASWAWLALAGLSERAMSTLRSGCDDEFLKSKGFRI
jgi:hypothetical protein